MEWTEAMRIGMDYIERHLTDDLTADDVACAAHVSSFYFQKGFAILCGYTVAEYIRFRRLSLAAQELATTDHKVIDVATTYGYDSPDSFTKAFTRFHGVRPSTVQKEHGPVKAFAPLHLSVSLKGGLLMNYKIEKKENFTVVGVSRVFTYEDCKKEIPAFWGEVFGSGKALVSGMYGINIDPKKGHDHFEYLIADLHDPLRAVPEGCITKTIPSFTWAVFSCDGPLPESFQDVNVKIFTEWLPALPSYEFAAGYCIESYDDPRKYALGTRDAHYHSEIWIPVRAKQEA